MADEQVAEAGGAWDLEGSLTTARRRSASISRVRRPCCAKIVARLHATVDLPSPGPGLVRTIVRRSRWARANAMFVRSERNASATSDWGSTCDINRRDAAPGSRTVGWSRGSRGASDAGLRQGLHGVIEAIRDHARRMPSMSPMMAARNTARFRCGETGVDGRGAASMIRTPPVFTALADPSQLVLSQEIVVTGFTGLHVCREPRLVGTMGGYCSLALRSSATRCRSTRSGWSRSAVEAARQLQVPFGRGDRAVERLQIDVAVVRATGSVADASSRVRTSSRRDQRHSCCVRPRRCRRASAAPHPGCTSVCERWLDECQIHLLLQRQLAAIARELVDLLEDLRLLVLDVGRLVCGPEARRESWLRASEAACLSGSAR